MVDNPCLSGGTLEIFLEAMMPAAADPRVRRRAGGPGARAGRRRAAGYDLVAAADRDAVIPPDAAAVVVASHGRDEEAVLAAARRRGGALHRAGRQPQARRRSCCQSVGADPRSGCTRRPGWTSVPADARRGRGVDPGRDHRDATEPRQFDSPHAVDDHGRAGGNGQHGAGPGLRHDGRPSPRTRSPRSTPGRCTTSAAPAARWRSPTTRTGT